MNPVHAFTSYLRSVLVLSSQLRVGLQSCAFPLGFQTNVYIYTHTHPHLAHICYLFHPSDPL